jgi:hypothetical protein
MKKIFTLLFAVGIVGIASAQSSRFDNHRPDYGYTMSKGRFDTQKINREYDFKIAAVKMDRYMSRREKASQIRFLENQRNAEIARAQYGFNQHDNRFNDHKFAESNKRKW